MGSWHRVIGIDLGTTFSAVSAFNFDKNDVKIIPNKQNEPTTPSVVYVSKEGQVSVGKAAKDKLAKDPDGVIFEVKRIMGDRDGAGTKAMVKLPGRPAYDPELISAHLLKELKSCAEKAIGEKVHDVVITVPAYFKESQKNATKEAARIAQLNPLMIINEPTAAAIAYGLDSGEKQTFIVYDFGGGTFDVSIVRVNDERSFDVLGTGGDSNLGGGDVDARIIAWGLQKLKEQTGKDYSGDPKVMGRLRLEAEKTKINLCNERAGQEVSIPGIDDFAATLSEPEFKAMIAPLLDRTLAQVEVAMRSAKTQHDLSWDDIEAFILVGGSSKIPYVTEALKEKFKKPVKSDLNPDEVVAIGAGWVAKSYPPSLGPQISESVERQIDPTVKTNAADHRDIKDVVSHTIGIGLKDDVFDRLITKDTVIPFKVTRDGYTTAEDNQTTVHVPVYQGEQSKASLNFKLGEVVVDSLTPEPKGTHKFSITFALDANGIFHGEMKHHQTGQVREVRLDRGQGQLTEKTLKQLSEYVNQGSVGPTTAPAGGGAAASAPPRDPIEELVQQASDLISRLPPEKNKELSSLLQKLAQARTARDQTEVSALVAQLTMTLMRYQMN